MYVSLIDDPCFRTDEVLSSAPNVLLLMARTYGPQVREQGRSKHGCQKPRISKLSIVPLSTCQTRLSTRAPPSEQCFLQTPHPQATFKVDTFMASAALLPWWSERCRLFSTCKQLAPPLMAPQQNKNEDA